MVDWLHRSICIDVQLLWAVPKEHRQAGHGDSPGPARRDSGEVIAISSLMPRPSAQAIKSGHHGQGHKSAAQSTAAQSTAAQSTATTAAKSTAKKSPTSYPSGFIPKVLLTLAKMKAREGRLKIV